MHQKIILSSKRNHVQRIISDDSSFVSKLFYDENNFNKEIELLSIMDRSGAKVPKILKSSKQELIMEDLGDFTLLSWYEKLEKQNSYDYEHIIIKLCHWLKNFYSITFGYFKQSYIVFDVNFRNFIIFNSDVYGIDFEQSCVGTIETDAGKLAAFALTYDPSYTEWKLKFHDKLIEILSRELNIKKEAILLEEQKEMDAIKKRRKNINRG